MKKNSKIEKIIKLALLEDIGSGDITSDSVVPTNRKADAVLLVKSNGIISGLDVAKKVFKLLDKKIVFQKLVKDGQYVESGKIISIIKGPARSILSAERTALNFLQRMSGISTLTNEFVNQIKGTNAKILDTRKTSPCLRYFDKYAVKMGGGYNHRLGLFDMILIKDNHIAVSGSITKAVELCRANLKKKKTKILIEVETKNLDEVLEAIDCKVDFIMLDNFSVPLIREAIILVNGKCKLEASGGINLKNVKQIAETGVDFISVGALTHSVKALDISLDVRIF